MKASVPRELIVTAADRNAAKRGYYVDVQAADRVRTFFREFLRHSKGEWHGRPFDLLAWQWDKLILPLFGWRQPDGRRRFRRAYVEIPKKNGKSALCSGLALYLLLADGEKGAEVYIAAADREQASIVYNEAANMVEASPSLAQVLEVVRSTKRIVHRESRSWMKALSAEAPTKEGLNIHGLIFDELHAQPNRELWDALAYGGRARRQPLFVSITTAGYDRHSICYEQHKYANSLLDGTNSDDLSFFPLIYAADDQDDWTLESTWRKANPSYGITVQPEAFRQDCEEAKAVPSKENAFRRYSLNQWTEQDVRWLPMSLWQKGSGLLDVDSLAGRTCYGGLDLSSVSDLSALVLLFPNFDDGDVAYDVLPFFWLPEERMHDRVRRDKVPYDVWVRDGYIETTPGQAVKFPFIRHRLNELANLYQIEEIAIDRWNAHQIAHELAGDGFSVQFFGQGYSSMSGPSKQLEGLFLEGRIRHGDNPVLRWMAGNCTIEQDAAGNIKPSKAKSEERIDGIVALVMALGRAVLKQDEGMMERIVW